VPRLMSFAKTVRQFRDGTKTVTRRDGWEFLFPGDVVEGVEWSPRAGWRWCCATCEWRGPYRFEPVPDRCPECESDPVFYRRPLRLGPIRVVSTRRERLGAVTPEEVAREGFPDLTPEEFIALYCAPGRPDPERMVTRIEFEHIEAPS
jgi:hypothetical protein